MSPLLASTVIGRSADSLRKFLYADVDTAAAVLRTLLRGLGRPPAALTLAAPALLLALERREPRQVHPRHRRIAADGLDALHGYAAAAAALAAASAAAFSAAASLTARTRSL